MVLGGRAMQRGAALGANRYLRVRPNAKRDLNRSINRPPMVVRAIASSVVPDNALIYSI